MACKLNLRGFNMGIERILTRIAETIDDKLPHGEGWHLLLWEQMTKEVLGIRPAVIATEIGTRLDEYRRFRHAVRNVYTHSFDPAELGKLVNSAPNWAPTILIRKKFTGMISLAKRSALLKEKEVRLYGEYRTRHLVLDVWDGQGQG